MSLNFSESIVLAGTEFLSLAVYCMYTPKSEIFCNWVYEIIELDVMHISWNLALSSSLGNTFLIHVLPINFVQTGWNDMKWILIWVKAFLWILKYWHTVALLCLSFILMPLHATGTYMYYSAILFSKKKGILSISVHYCTHCFISHEWSIN